MPCPPTSATPSILFEDELLLVLDKPAGLPCLPGTGISISVLDWIRTERPALLELPGPRAETPSEAGMLHRLDNGTSGTLAFAKTAAEYTRLRALWNSGEIRKTYLALSQPADTAPALAALADMRIQNPIGHSAKSGKRMIVLDPARPQLERQIRGEPQTADTRILSAQKFGNARELTVEIRTGVRHQIRAHLASIGHPLLGDEIYGGAPYDRPGLHAWRLDLPRASGERLKVESPRPWIDPSHDE